MENITKNSGDLIRIPEQKYGSDNIVYSITPVDITRNTGKGA